MRKLSLVVSFVKEWTLPVAIAVGTVSYLTFSYVPQLGALGDSLGPVFDVLLPLFVLLTLLVTFCRVDFSQLRPHRWHAGVLAAQLLLVVADVALVLCLKGPFAPSPSTSGLQPSPFAEPVLWEALLTCIIGPTAASAPVLAGKLGGNISTMTTYVLLSSLLSSLLIPLVFPLLEPAAGISFTSAFLTILNKVCMVLLLPLVLGWLVQRRLPLLARWLNGRPDLSFYCWSVSLSITTGITVKNIVHSTAPLSLLVAIAGATFALCFVQFVIGRVIGRCAGGPQAAPAAGGVAGVEVNAGQALFQKNTALSIWASYMYLHPVASVGAGCYVLWQNIVNSAELWLQRRQK